MALTAAPMHSTFDILGGGVKYFNLLGEIVFNQPNESKKRLQTRMDLYGIETRKKVPGDGNCQFYSLSDQLTGSFNYASFIRSSVISWLGANGDIVLV